MKLLILPGIMIIIVFFTCNLYCANIIVISVFCCNFKSVVGLENFQTNLFFFFVQVLYHKLEERFKNLKIIKPELELSSGHSISTLS